MGGREPLPPSTSEPMRYDNEGINAGGGESTQPTARIQIEI